MGKQITRLTSYQSVCLDTNIIAYYVEGNSTYGEAAKSLLTQLVKDKKTACLTFLSLSELLVKPLVENEESLVDFYSTIDKNFPISIIYPTFDSVLFTAHIRAKYNLPTPDAINLAIAKSHALQAFITNDESLKKVSEITVLTLQELSL